jgi:hypothetical protein
MPSPHFLLLPHSFTSFFHHYICRISSLVYFKMLLAPSEVRELGLGYMKVRLGRKNQKTLDREFQRHFGSTHLDIAEAWYDLCHYKDWLSSKEKSRKGFKRFLAAQFWLWTRPKNASVFASRFGLCKDYVQGKELWKWIEHIANLAEKKIVWDPSLDAGHTEIFAVTADGVDFPLWEIQHPEFPYDTKSMSHKFRSCGAKYIIALSVQRSKCVLIAGPYKGGKPDLDIFKDSGLMKKLQDSGKVCIADRGYRSKIASEREVFAYPDFMDCSAEMDAGEQGLYNFKSRARCRQETYNRRLKHFMCLSSTFKNGFAKHGIALRAVAVMVQYQMDNGSPLYAV